MKRVVEAGVFVILNLFYCMCACVVYGILQYRGSEHMGSTKRYSLTVFSVRCFPPPGQKVCVCVFVETNRIALAASWNGCSQDRWEGG